MSKNSNPYASRAMLVSVSFSKWEPRKYDRKVSEEVAQKHNTDLKAGRYNKRLFLATPKSLEAVNSAISAAQQTYYDETLPWSDDGCRLLPTANFMKFSEAMRAHKSQIEDAVQAFAQDYPDLVEQAAADLNGLYNREDYPDAAQIADRFGMAIKVYPVPEGRDFRVDLSAEHLADLRQQIDADTEAAIQDAVMEAYGLLFDACAHMVEMLSAKDPKRSIRDVLVTNTRQTVGRVQRLNLTNDPRLTSLGKRIVTDLCESDGATLRGSDFVRDVTVKSAARLTKELADILGIPMPQAEPEPEQPKRTRKAAPQGKAKTKAKPQAESAPEGAPTLAQADAIANDLAAMMGMQ